MTYHSEPEGLPPIALALALSAFPYVKGLDLLEPSLKVGQPGYGKLGAVLIGERRANRKVRE